MFLGLIFSVALTPDSSFTPPRVVSSAEQLSDLTFLKDHLEKTYAGPKSFGENLASLTVTSDHSPAEFCAQLAQAMVNVRDQHLRAFLNFKPCDDRQVVGHVGSNRAGAAAWKVENVTSPRGSTAVLSIARFLSDRDPSWHGFLEAVRQIRTKSEPFILDLRGNSGGDDSMGFEMARILYGMSAEMILPNPLREQEFLQTPEALQIQANLGLYRMARDPVPRAEDFTRYQDFTLASRQPGERLKITRMPHTSVGANAFPATIYILTDHVCASACETTLQVLEGLPHQVRIGEPTRGAVEYGQVGLLVLPYSRIAIQLSTLKNLFWDDRHPEGVGYSPQIAVPPGEDAFRRALQILR